MKSMPLHLSHSKRQHRSLSRTEYSLSKLQSKREKERSKTISSQTHLFLISANNQNVVENIQKELKGFQKKVRTESGKKLIGIFKKAHQASEHQTFLQRVPKQRTKILNNQVRHVLRIGRIDKSSANKTIEVRSQSSNEKETIPNKTLQNEDRLLSAQTKNATISYTSNKRNKPLQAKNEQKQQISNKSIVEANTSINLNSKQMQISFNNLSSNFNSPKIEQTHRNTTAQTNQQSKVPTVKKKFRKYQRQAHNPQLQTEEKVKIQIDKTNEQKPEQTVYKQQWPITQTNFDKLKTIEAIDNEGKKKATKQKQKSEYYKSIYSDVNQIDIQEIALIDSKPKQKEKPKQEKTWSQVKQNAKKQTSPYLPIESNAKPNQHKEKSMLKLQANIESKLDDDTNIKQITNKQDPKEITKQSQQSISKAQNTIIIKQQVKMPSQKQKQKLQVMQILGKIAKAHSKLQMMGQLATYFSKNTSYFKLGEQNKSFLRNQSISWHLMVYLFFKYFYYMLVLFYKYYLFASQVVLIKSQQLKELHQENQKWLQTLNKIQKSVKKNADPKSFDQSLFHTPQIFKGLQQKANIMGLIQIYFGQEGNEQELNFSICMNYLREKIYKQVAAFIKSMNISNILCSNSNHALILKEAAFRVFNSAIILYQFHNNSSHFETYQNMEKLKNPQLQDFKRYYQKLTKQILIKK